MTDTGKALVFQSGGGQAMNPYSLLRDILVQQTTADYLEQKRGWELIYAYNNEASGQTSLLSRASDHEVVLTCIDLLNALKEKLRIDQWRDKETTRDAVRVTIRDFLWSDNTGLPVDLYAEDDVAQKAEDVFRHVFWAYPTLPSPYYEAVVA